MSLSGTITTYPLPDLLQWLSMTRKTGILSLIADQSTVTLVFRDGLLITASSSDLAQRFAEYLLARGLVTESQLAETLDANAGDLGGRFLVERGLLSEAALADALRDGARDIVYGLFLLEDAMFHFSPEILPPEDSVFIALDLHIDALLMEGARRLDEWGRFREVLPTDEIRINRNAAAEPDADAPTLWGILHGLLAEPRTIGELIAASHRTPFEVYEALFGMRGAQLVEASETAGAVRDTRLAELPPEELEAEIFRLVDGRVFDRARARLEQIREHTPDNTQLPALSAWIASEELDFLRTELPGDALPALAVGLDQLQRLELSPRDAFLLSRLGSADVDVAMLCTILPLSEVEVLRELFALREKGIIRIG